MTRITQQDIAQYLETGEAASDILPILQQYDPAYQVRQAAGTAQPTGGLLSAKPDEGAGFWGTLREGAENTGRALAGAGNVLTGDGQALAEKAKAQAEPSANPFLRQFYESIAKGRQDLGQDPSMLDSIGMVGSSIWNNPKGAAYAALEQLPNAAAVLAPAWAGAKAGAVGGGFVAGPVGAAAGGVVGGLAGMFLGNATLETGFKGIEAGADGELTDAERSQVLQEGAVKGAVLTGVDAVTLGASKFVLGATNRAVEQATRRALVDSGVDVADAAAVQAARQAPEIVQAVQAAQKQAIATSNRLAPKMARGAAALGLETTGEGLGEYLGELAATGQGDMADAVLEAFLGLGQSVAEASWGAARNGAQLARQTAFDKLEGARQQAAAQGGDALAQELAATEAASQSMQERLALPAPQQAAPIMVDRQGTAMTQADAERITLRPGMSFGRDDLAQQVEQWDAQARNMRATRDPLRERQAGELEALASDGRAALLGYGDFQRGPAKATGLLGVLKERGYTPTARPAAAGNAAAGNERPDGQGSVTFQTAKGSIYQAHEDGTTSRDKAFRPEHGEAEQGPQPRSSMTFYVDEAGLNALGEFQAQGVGSRRMVVKGQQAAVQYDDGPSAGMVERRTVTDFKTQPATGLYPVELWDDGKTVHFGNRIVSVNSAAPPDAQPQQAAGQYQLGEPAQPVGAEPSGLYRALQVGGEREQARVDDFNAQVATVQREQMGDGEAPQYALPAGLELADKQGAGRFLNDLYRQGVDGLVGQLVEGGDVAYLKDKHGRIIGRTSSVNPTWWQGMDTKVKPGSIAEARRVVQKALAGEKLGPKQARFISAMLDVVDAQRGLDARNEQAQFDRQALEPAFEASAIANRFEHKQGGRRHEVSDEDQAELYDYLTGKVEPFRLDELEPADIDSILREVIALDDTTEATQQAGAVDDEGEWNGDFQRAVQAGGQVPAQQGLPGGGRRAAENGGAAAAAGQQAGRTESLTAPAADELLQNYSAADLQARDDRQARATQAQATTRKAEADKAQADRDRNDFTLTGSDRPADLAAARGQNNLFGAGRRNALEDAAHSAATSPHNDLPEPTEAQKEAGNYRKGHVTVQGLDLAIENPRGSERSGKRPDGSEWRHTMSDHYGYIKRTEGADGEQVDVYLGPYPDSARVFVVDQLDQQSGGFDEHKVMLGFKIKPQAVAAYRRNFDADWQLGPVTELSVEQFKEWLRSGDLSQPLGKKGVAVGDLQHLRQIVRQSNVPAKNAIAAARAAITSPDRTDAERQALLEEVGATGAGSLAELNAALDKWWKRHFRERAAHKAKGKAEVEAFERQRREQDVEDTLALGRQAAAELDGRRADPVREMSQPAAEQPAAKPVKPKAAKPAKAKPLPKSYGEGNKLVTADRAEELRKKLLAKLGQVNSGIDPELVAIGTELAVFHIEAGARKFMDMARALADHLGVPMQSLRPYLRSWYNGARDMMEDTGHAVADMDDATTVRAQLAAMDALAADTLETNNDESAADESGADGSVEQDRADADAGDRVGEVGISDDTPADGQGAGVSAGENGEGRLQQHRDSGLSDDGALAGRERGDSSVRDGKPGTGTGAAGSADGRRGAALRGAGVANGREGRADAAGAAEQAVSHDSNLEQKRAAQREAAKLPVKAGDLENVRASLPFLLDLQQEDVHKTEQRFLTPEGYGMLLTNGTGTGKTYSGSGAIARSVYQGHDSVLVIAPSAVQQEWLTALDNMGVPAKLLASIKDNGGRGVVVTTHENAGQNDSLVQRQWDLVVVDESHKLLENLQGDPTLALKTLRAVTLHPRGAYSRARQLRPDDYARIKELRGQIDANSKMLNAQDGVDTDGLRATNTRLEAEFKRLAAELRAHEERVAAEVQAAQGAERTRALFLSATPFASHFALDYAEGYLFSYGPEKEGSLAYNEPGAREGFFVANFGYRMRYNKLTRPDAEVNSAVMEVEFNERLKREGAVSGRALVSDRDYSRDFILIDDAVGAKIDEGIEWLREQAKENPAYSALNKQLEDRFDYLARMRLLEAIKARHALPIIQKHLAMGRKVYVMHDYIDGGGFHPFRFVPNGSVEVAGEQIDMAEVIRDFNKARPDLVGLDLSQLQSPLAVLGGAFGDKLLQYNGRQPRKYLEEAKRAFNRDGGEQNVMLIQRQKGKAGISLHDTTGKHQRVMIDLGIPGRATDAIQGEGRGYRVGVQSDLPILYMTTATSFENFAFAHKTAERSGTAENLGMGSLARGLRDSILAAYQAPIEGYEPHDGEGKGGKARDRELAVANGLTPFERAKTFYFGQQKNSKRRDQREGTDYFATPEPAGFKMVEWADIRPGDDVAEPSAGHGAIARFFPESAKRVLIEPSMRLASKAGLSAPGATVINDDFESHHVVNKYDAIVMNPPYGMGGKTAAEHVAKAIKHLRDGGRVVALIPEGPSADKRFEKLLEETPHVYQVGSVSLPRVTFERAGTQVKTRVLVLEKQETDEGRAKLQPSRDLDLSGAESIGELFDRLENIGMRDRVPPAKLERAEAPAQDKPAKQSYAEKAAAQVEKYVTDAAIIEHTVSKSGKVLRGVIVTDMSLAEVKAKLDKYAFPKDGGVFVRQDYIQRPDAESRYSLRSSEIDQFIGRVTNTRNPRMSQVVGETPAVFELLGEKKLPVQLRSGVVLKALGGKHELSADQLKQALAQLNDPVMVFDSNTEAGAMVALTEVRDDAGRAVVVALHFEQQAGHHVLHDIATVHGRNSDQHMVHWIRQGLLAYRNKKTSRSWLQSVPLQLRWEGVRNDQRGRVYTESDLRATGAGYRLTYGAAKAMPPFRVKALGQKLRGAGLPVEVVVSEAQLPAELQEQIRRDGASGRVEGTYHDGVAYLVAGNLSSDKRALQVALHELVGHGGVQAVLGERIEAVMAQVYRDMPAELRQAIEADYAGQLAGLTRAQARQVVAEEYLAHLAETDPRNGLVAKLIGMLRNWLRQVFGDKLAMQWTREDLLELLASARRAVSHGESSAGVRYAVDTESRLAPVAVEATAFRDEVDRAMAVRGQIDRMLTIGRTPAVLRALGAPDLPISIAKDTILKATNGVKHDVRLEDVKRLPELLADPVMVFGSKTEQGALVVLIEVSDASGRPVLVAMHLNRQNKRVLVNRVASAYGKDGAEGFVRREIAQGRLQYRHEQKSREWFQSRGLQLPKEGATHGLEQKVLTDADIFKSDVSPGGSTRYSLSGGNADREALRKLGLSGSDAKTLTGKLRDAFEGDWRAQLRDLGKRTTEGLFDGLAGIKAAEEAVGVTDADQSGYVSARLASGLADVMHGVLHYGAPEWRDGIIQPREGTRGLLDVLGDLGAEQLTDWLGWLGGKRAQLLMRQGRENNLSAAEIDELLALAKGREQLFERTYQEYAKLNDAVLDLAQEAGLIGAESRQKWLTDYYVPFYRSTDGEGLFGAPRTKRGLSHQSAAIKALRGGEVPTNDLLENMLTAWSKRIDASMKNKALLEVVDNLQGSDYLSDESVRYTQAIIPRSEIAKRVKADRKTLVAVAGMLGMQEGADAIEVAGELMKPENEGFEKLWALTAPTDPDIIRVQRDGKNEYYRVNDPALLRSVKAMAGSQFNDPITRMGRWFKRLLTTGVTASPDFIARNFIRDAAHAWLINKDGFKLGVDSIKGLREAFAEDADYQALMFAGASFQGGYVHGADPEASAQIIRRALEKKGLSASQRDAYMDSLVATPAQMRDALWKGWQKYRELGDKVENANRLSTYKAALAAGKSKRQAAFEAKDLMDYSLRGNFAALVWFTDVVPFLNARLQGLYKLGRAAKGDKTLIAKEVASKGLYLALFSLMLAGLNDDDERYQALEDWDKDMNWHIFLGDEHVRMPKPFELGLLFGTIPERLLHASTGTQDAGDLGRAMVRGVVDTLAFNPVPQFYQPIREVQANRDFFRERPIEGMADEGKLPEARYDSRTSALGVLLGQMSGPLFGISPKQLDHLVVGYTGTIGAYVLGISSWLAGAAGEGETPDRPISDWPVIKGFYQGDAPRSTRYQSQFYDMLQETEQLYRTVRAYRAEGRQEDAAELLADSRDKLRHRQALGFARQQLGAIRKRMDAVHRDPALSGAEKRQRLDDLQRRANDVAERITQRAGADF